MKRESDDRIQRVYDAILAAQPDIEPNLAHEIACMNSGTGVNINGPIPAELACLHDSILEGYARLTGRPAPQVYSLQTSVPDEAEYFVGGFGAYAIAMGVFPHDASSGWLGHELGHIFSREDVLALSPETLKRQEYIADAWTVAQDGWIPGGFAAPKPSDGLYHELEYWEEEGFEEWKGAARLRWDQKDSSSATVPMIQGDAFDNYPPDACRATRLAIVKHKAEQRSRHNPDALAELARHLMDKHYEL